MEVSVKEANWTISVVKVEDCKDDVEHIENYNKFNKK